MFKIRNGIREIYEIILYRDQIATDILALFRVSVGFSPDLDSSPHSPPLFQKHLFSRLIYKRQANISRHAV